MVLASDVKEGTAAFHEKRKPNYKAIREKLKK